MNFIRSLLKKHITIITLVSLTSSCATFTSRYQYVKIDTQNKNDKIYLGKKLVGQGPSIINIKRTNKINLKVVNNKKITKYRLKTRYQWANSFAANLFWFYLAPVGWLTDILSGAAYNIYGIKIKKKIHTDLDSKDFLFILPPISDSQTLSDEIARVNIKLLQKQFPKANIINYEKSIKLAFELGFNNSKLLDLGKTEIINELLYKSKATHVVSSIYKENKNKLILQIHDGYSGHKIFKKSYKYETKTAKKSKIILIDNLFDIIPNTIAFEFVTDSKTPVIHIDENEDKDFNSKSSVHFPLNILKNISLKNIIQKRHIKPWHFSFKLSPNINVFYNKSVFKNIESQYLNGNLTLIRSFFNLGYGIRLNYSTSFGIAFIEYSPFLAWYYLNIINLDYKESKKFIDIGISLIYGIDYWLNSRWNMKLFIKADTHNYSKNADAILKNIHKDSNFKSIDNNLLIGLSVGYFFFSEKRNLRKLIY